MLRPFWLSSYRRLLPRWRGQHVLVHAKHETTGGVLPSPREPTVPRNFGLKTSWFALRTTDALGVARCLRLLEVKEAGWEEGLRVGYERPAFSERLERKGQLLSSWCFITPAVRGWTLVVGSQKLCSQTSQDTHQEEESLAIKLSKCFGQAQAFATHRVGEYQSWIWATDGVLLRSFAICGDNAEIVSDYGTLTPIEESFDWNSHYAWLHASSDLSRSAWFPDEFAVMRVAGAWSVDPTALEEMSRDEFEGGGWSGEYHGSGQGRALILPPQSPSASCPRRLFQYVRTSGVVRQSFQPICVVYTILWPSMLWFCQTANPLLVRVRLLEARRAVRA